MGISRATASITAATCALVLVFLPACSARNCTLIGAESGVNVRIDPSLSAGDQPASVEICRESLCAGVRIEAGTTEVFVPLELGPGTVELLVTWKPDEGPDRARTESVVTRKFQPNGEACGPTVWTAAVTG